MEKLFNRLDQRVQQQTLQGIRWVLEEKGVPPANISRVLRKLENVNTAKLIFLQNAFEKYVMKKRV